MAIIQQASGSFTATTSVVVSLPAASTTGNRVVVFIMGTTTFPAPTGWTLRTSQVNWMGHYLFDKAGGSGGNTFTSTVAGDGLWYAAEVSGTFDAAAGVNSTPDATTYTTPNLTPTAGGRTLFASIGSIEPGTVRTVDGWTGGFVEQSDAYLERAGGDWPSGAVATQEVTATGSTVYATTTTFSLASGGRSALIASYTSTPSGAANVAAVVAGLSITALAPDVYEEQIVFGGTTPGFILAAPAPVVAGGSGVQVVGFAGSGTLALSGTPTTSGSLALSGSGTLAGIRTGTLTGSAAFTGSGTLTTSAVPRHAQPASFSGSGALTGVSIPTLSFVSAGAGASTSNTNLLVDPPTTYAAGDLLVMFVSYRGTLRDVAVPAGWTLLAPWDNQHRVMGKIAAATEPSVAIDLTGIGTTSAGETHQGMMGAFRSSAGWASLASIVDTFTTSTGSAQDIATPAVNVTKPGSLVLAFGFRHDDWISAASPTGFTEIGEVVTTLGNDSGLTWGYAVRNADQDPGVDAFTITGGVASTYFSAMAAISVGIVAETAAFTGSGTLEGLGFPRGSSPLDFAGDGTLGLSGVPRATGSVPLAGSGTLAGSGVVVVSGSVPFTGSGTLAPTSSAATFGALGLFGSGSLAVSGSTANAGAAAFTGSGSLAPTGTPTTAGTFAASGSGTLGTSGKPSTLGTAGFSGTGNLFLGSAAGYGSAIFFSGSGTLGGVGTAGHNGTIGLSGLGSLAGAGRADVSAVVGFAGSGQVSFQGRVLSSAEFSGAGQIVFVGVPGGAGSIFPTGSGSLAGSGREGYFGAAAFTGSGTLGLFPIRIGSVGLSGSGTLGLVGAPGGRGSAALAGFGALAGGASRFTIVAALAYFSSNGEIQGYQERMFVSGAVGFAGTGALVGTILNPQHDVQVDLIVLTSRRITAQLTPR